MAPLMFTFGGMAVFGGGMLLGYEAANMTSRYFEGIDPSVTPAPTLPSGITTIQQYNELVQAAPPSFKRTGIELGVSLLGFLVGIFSRGPLLKLFGYGWGFGALTHIVGALLDGYIIRPMFTTSTASTTGGAPTVSLSNTGQRMWQHEQTAASAKTAAATAGGATLGAPPANALAGGNRQLPQGNRGGTPIARRPQQPVMIAQMNHRHGQPPPPQAQPVAAPPPPPSTSLTPPPGYVRVTLPLPASTDNGNGTSTCPNGDIVNTGTPCRPPAYLELQNGYIQANGTPVASGGVVTAYWYPPAQNFVTGGSSSPSLTPPAGYVRVALPLPASTDNGNGTSTCPNGDIVNTGTPCRPPAYLELQNGYIQANGTPVASGGVVTAYWYPPAQNFSAVATPAPNPSGATPSGGRCNVPGCRHTGGCCAVLPPTFNAPTPPTYSGDPPEDEEVDGETPHPLKAARAGLRSTPRTAFMPRNAA